MKKNVSFSLIPEVKIYKNCLMLETILTESQHKQEESLSTFNLENIVSLETCLTEKNSTLPSKPPPLRLLKKEEKKDEEIEHSILSFSPIPLLDIALLRSQEIDIRKQAITTALQYFQEELSPIIK